MTINRLLDLAVSFFPFVIYETMQLNMVELVCVCVLLVFRENAWHKIVISKRIFFNSYQIFDWI